MPLCPISARAFQEYLEALAGVYESACEREKQLLFAYAEFRFKMRGGGKCALCHATVRHVIPVEVNRMDGTQLSYPCLCTRCMEGEKAVSRRMVQRLGQLSVVYVAPGYEEEHPLAELHVIDTLQTQSR